MNDEIKQTSNQDNGWDDDWKISASPSSDFDADAFFGDEESFAKEQSALPDDFDFEAEPCQSTIPQEIEGWVTIADPKQQLVIGDIIRFDDSVWDKNWPNNQYLGSRTVVALITKETYGKDGQIRITYKVIESEGIEALIVGSQHWKLRRNIRVNCYRKKWDDESLRQELVRISQVNAENAQREFWRKKKEAEEQMFAEITNGISGSRNENRVRIVTDEAAVDNEQLSAEQQQWLCNGWQSSIADLFVGCLAEYNVEKGFKLMDDTEDRIVNGDIICFLKSNYIGRYPYGKYCGRSFDLAKVIKIGTQYYHLISSEDNQIKSKREVFRCKFETVRRYTVYRLYWRSELLRKDTLGKQIKKQFSSQQEYEEYVGEEKGNVALKNKSSNSEKILKEEMMEQNVDVMEWLRKQDDLEGEVFIKDGGYAKMSRGRDPSPISLSNFALMPTAKIVQGNQWWFECVAVNNGGIIKEGILLSRDDFQSPSAFKRALASDSRLEYYGDSKDTTRIQGLLTNQRPRIKEGTDKLGIHRLNGRWVYVEGSRVVDSNCFINDIVFTTTNLKQDELPCLLQQRDITDADLKAIAANLNKFNEPAIVYPLLGWIGFCFVKERLSHKVNKRNPILLCQGEPGTGKTETVSRILLRMLGNQKPICNIADVTKFALAVNGSRSNFAPCCYDEWKESVMSKAKKKDLDSVITATFGQTNLPRGTAEQTVNDYCFTSPLVILGEMTLESACVKHRIIELFFNYKGRTGKEAYFRNLCELPLGSFGKSLLMYTLSLSDNELDSIFEEQKALVDQSIEGRFADNAALTRVGLRLIIGYLAANGINTDEYIQGLTCIDTLIMASLKESKLTNVEKTLQDLSVMSHTRNCSGNWLNKGYHYEIRDNLIYLRIAEVYDAYRRFAKSNDISSEIINKTSLLQQLQTKTYFEGKKTYRIGGTPCNAVCLNLSAIPQIADINFAA